MCTTCAYQGILSWPSDSELWPDPCRGESTLNFRCVNWRRGPCIYACSWLALSLLFFPLSCSLHQHPHHSGAGGKEQGRWDTIQEGWHGPRGEDVHLRPNQAGFRKGGRYKPEDQGLDLAATEHFSIVKSLGSSQLYISGKKKKTTPLNQFVVFFDWSGSEDTRLLLEWLV